ncbi:MAG: sigma-70 family RNA polymerase sigma factor [Ilumatobacteraceae bacterium]
MSSEVIVAGVTFEGCFREHFGRLVALAASVTGDRDLAGELAQEAFVRLHRNWSVVQSYDDPGGWLRRVLANLLIDHHRSRDAERRAVVRLANRAGTEQHGTTDVGDDWAVLVAGLPQRQRLIVTLFYGEDRSVTEIATILDVSPNTVKSALSKARDALRERWEQDHD